MPVTMKETPEIVANVRLCEWGTSRGIRINKRMCKAIGIDIGDELDVRSGIDGGGSFIVIRPVAEHRSYGSAACIPMEQAFEGYEGGYVPSEFDWGCDVGAEVVE